VCAVLSVLNLGAERRYPLETADSTALIESSVIGFNSCRTQQTFLSSQ